MCNTRGKYVHLCKSMCTTTCKFAEPPIFLSLNQPRSPGWLIFQTCFLADHPRKMWHLCYKNYLQHSWSIAPWKCDICATKMIGNKYICRFCWFSITPITVDPFSVQSVRDYTKAWLTADRPSSSPRTSITVFPCLPTKTPLLTRIQGRWGEGRDRFSSTKILRHQFRILSKPTAVIWNGSAWNFLF